MAAGEEDETERVRRSSSKTPAKKSARKTSTGRASSRTSEERNEAHGPAAFGTAGYAVRG